MRRVRTIIPHCDMDSSVIDSFQCDQCSWSYAIAQPKSFLIVYEEAERACAAFDEHCCDNFNPRTVDDGPATAKVAVRPAMRKGTKFGDNGAVVAYTANQPSSLIEDHRMHNASVGIDPTRLLPHHSQRNNPGMDLF